MRTELQDLTLGYAQTSKDAALLPPSGRQLHIYELKARNESGGAIDVGILKRLNPDSYSVYTVVDLSSPKATLNATLKAGSATAIFTGTASDGYLIQSSIRFSMIGFNISTAGNPGAVTFSYYKATGYSTLTTYATPVYTSTGTINAIFYPPHDWIAGNTVTGASSDKYSILVTSAGGAVVRADSLWVGDLIEFQEAVADHTNVSKNYFSRQPLILAGVEGIQPYFSGASANNSISITYAVQS